jgi:hypothetical protein
MCRHESNKGNEGEIKCNQANPHTPMHMINVKIFMLENHFLPTAGAICRTKLDPKNKMMQLPMKNLSDHNDLHFSC